MDWVAQILEINDDVITSFLEVENFQIHNLGPWHGCFELAITTKPENLNGFIPCIGMCRNIVVQHAHTPDATQRIDNCVLNSFSIVETNDLNFKIDMTWNFDYNYREEEFQFIDRAVVYYQTYQNNYSGLDLVSNNQFKEENILECNWLQFGF